MSTCTLPTRDTVSRRRRVVQWVLAPVVLIVIALGWKYPLLGFSVPVVMLAGMIGGAINGRYVCGHLCPRGAFYDRMMAPLSPKRPIPRFLRSTALRWMLVTGLMGFMVYRIMQNPGSIEHWGRVFWLMCAVTTAIGIPLALIFHQRTWCSLCPIGTIQNAIGGGKNQLRVDSSQCRECAVCEKACPMNLPIVKHKASGAVRERDCLKCPECIEACPMGVLSWPESKTATSEDEAR